MIKSIIVYFPSYNSRPGVADLMVLPPDIPCPKTENEVIMLTFPADMTVSQKQAFEKRYRQAAASYFPMRVSYYHQFTGGTYSRITIRGQHTRWGSCSSRGTLSFNWRLMMAPPKVLDYVVVHELCHLKHMDHSRNFWNAVAEVMPDYKEQKNG